MTGHVHVWERVDVGGYRKTWHCDPCDAFRHPMCCWDDEGDLACVCGVDNDRRPVIR